MAAPIPLIPGCNPDPSIVPTSAGFFVVTSTFEYLPGLPVYRSDDLERWELVGHVATRPEQPRHRRRASRHWCVGPTIRHHDGRYHVIAEGGTERGHAVSVARSTSPAGPFESHPRNPVSARGTTRKVQCTGHGDLVQTGDCEWKLVHLGTWAEGQAYRFAPLGRETYLTDVTWEDGWPVIAPLLAEARTPLDAWSDDFDGDLIGPEWMSMRRLPTSLARIEAGHLVIDGEGRTIDDRKATFVGRRLAHVHGRVAVTLRAGDGDTVGGLALRFDERHHLDVEVRPGRVVARLVLPTTRQEHEATVEAGWSSLPSTSTQRIPARLRRT